jgi:large repetitive protein
MRTRLGALGLAAAAAAFGFPNPEGTCEITSPALLPAAVLNTTTSIPIATFGCYTPLKLVEVATGSLPAGLSIVPGTTRIEGRPTAAGVYAFSLRVIDDSNQFPSKAFVLRVAAPVQIETPALASATAGVSYTDQVRASGGSGSYSFSVAGGAFPTGVTMNGAGQITGTPSGSGPFTVRIRATDNATGQIGEKPFTIPMQAARITTTTAAPTGSVGTAYSFDIDSDLSGTGFSVVLGALPPGLTMNAAGLISGTPSATGTYHFAVRCTLNNTSVWRSYYIPVNAAGTVTGAPRGAEQSFAYDHVFGVNGGVGPYTFAVTSGTLPSGLTLQAATGALYGEVPEPLLLLGDESKGAGAKETQVDSHTFTITATDSTGRQFAQSFTIPVFDPMRITEGASSPPGAPGLSYTSAALNLFGGGTGPLSYRQLGGVVPPGTSLSGSTGIISGTPTQGGSYDVGILVTDAMGGTVTGGQFVFIYDQFEITKKDVPNARAGDQGYSQFISNEGGRPTISYGVAAGTLPPGMNFSSTTGFLTGPATTPGSYNFTLSATDAFGRVATQAYSMRVSTAVAIDQASLPPAVTNVAYSQQMTLNGGSTPSGSWSVSGTLPPGLTLSVGGLLNGIPTTPGTYTFTISFSSPPVALPINTDSRAFTLNVSPDVTISNTSPLPAGSQGVPYSQTLTGAGGRTPYRFELNDSSLPDGLNLNKFTGVISGVPRQTGQYSTSFLITDADGRRASKSLVFNIWLPVLLEPHQLPNGTRTVPYSQSVTASGGIPGYTYSALPGTLPTGLTLGSGTGSITGTPTANGTFVFTVTATDTQGRSGSKTYSVSISDPLTITSPTTLTNGQLLASYSDIIATAGGSTPKQFSISSGNIPPLLALSAGAGGVSNLPLLPGQYNFSVLVTDLDGRQASKAHQITVNTTFVITPPSLPSGTVGTAYSQALGTVGATPPVAFGVSSGTLPGGLTLSPAGVLSGTPTTAGTFNFTVSASDSQFGLGSQAYTIVVSNPLVISTLTLPNGSQGIPYNRLVQTTGGRLPVNVTLVAGTLPTGFAVGVTAADPGIPGGTNTPVGGTPSTPGVYNFTLGAADTEGRTTNRLYTVTIFSPMANASTLGDGTEGEAYSGQLAVTGGAGGVTWTIPVGTLPPGLVLNPATGALTGTPAAGGQFNFTARATDALGVQANFPLGILVYARLLVTTSSLPSTLQTVAYANTLAATGGRTPYTWALTGGALPSGFTLNPATGAITGTTNAPEGPYAFLVRVTDSRGRTHERQLAMIVDPAPAPPLVLSPTSLPNGRVNDPYSAGVAASGGTPPYALQLAQGAPPPGLTFSNGAIAGTPTQEGTFRFTINVTDARGRTTGNLYSVLIEPALLPLVVTPDTIGTAQVNQPFSAGFGATGGRPPYGFALAGALPAGLSFNTAGLLSGTPSEGGSFGFNVTVTDALGNRASRGYTLVVTGSLVITTQAPLPEGTVGTAYTVGFAASGGRTPYSWQISGTPPPGLSFDSATGALTGTPSQEGTFGFTVQVTDAQRVTASRGFSIRIYDRLQITNSPSNELQPANQPYSFGFATTGGKAPVAFALTGGGLPPGLSLSVGGAIAGTPTQGGNFSFNVEATDALGNKAAGGGTIRVADPLTVTTTSLPNATQGAPYSAGVSASGGIPPLGAWTISAGALPAGLTMSATGAISGTPTATGTASFTVRITDSRGGVATRGLSIAVGLPAIPPITITGLPATLPPGQQPNIGLQITQPFPAPITGRMTLEFTPAATNNADDPAVQFSSGGRTVTFNIPSGQTGATFPVDPLRILTGTVAGTIRIRVETTPAGTFEDRIITIARAVPVITAGSVQQATGSFTVQVDGFSNTRELSGATFRFTPVAGANLQTTEVTLNVGQLFTAWYQSTASQPFGGQFRLTVPFTVQGTLNDVDTIVVTLTNSVGASQPFTIRLR